MLSFWAPAPAAPNGIGPARARRATAAASARVGAAMVLTPDSGTASSAAIQ
jgi:hypothetical protein